MSAVGAAITAATALAGFLAAVLSILRYLNYRTRRDRIAAVGAALDAVVASLAADNDVQRAAAAIRLRRFFDPRSELGVAGTAYARDALNVIAAVLRDLPAGNLQKLLADGLAYAPSLAGADLQRTNLQNVYLANVDMVEADLFQSDLTGGSIKGADARQVSFYRAQLVRTVLADADLRDAWFFESDLRDARFVGANLTGARFTRCENLPPAVAEQLDSEGRFTGTAPFRDVERHSEARPRFFVSRPFLLSADQIAILRLVTESVRSAGGDVLMVDRIDSSPAGVLTDVRQAMSDCAGVIVLGFRQLEVTEGRSRAGTQSDELVTGVTLATPWNHAEAGLARGIGLPIFRMYERGVSGGVFDAQADVAPLVDLAAPGGLEEALRAVNSWVRTLATA